MSNQPKASAARADLRSALGKCLESSLNRLDSIWHEIGFLEEEKCQRTKTVFEHIHALLDDLATEEEEGRKKLKESADQHAVEYAKLCKELSVADEPISNELSLLAREGELRQRATVLQKERHRRVSKARALVSHEENLCTSLRQTRQLQDISRDYVPSKEQLQKWQTVVDNLSAEKDQRVSQLAGLQQRLQHLWSELERSPAEDSFDNAMTSCNVEDLTLTDETSQRGEALCQELEKELSQMEETAAGLRGQLVTLWKRLVVPSDEQDAFLQAHGGHKTSAISAMEIELQRLEELKRQHMGKFIQAVREELVTLWDSALYGPKQRQEFHQANDTDFSEELLAAHEGEADRLRQFVQNNLAVFQMVEKREHLWTRMQELNASAKNPNRYNNRGGQLLKEEKMRKTIAKELPKVEKELSSLLTDWEAREQTHFLVNDERYLDMMTWQKESVENKKEADKLKRQMSKKATLQENSHVSQVSITPVKRRLAPSSSSSMAKKSTTPNVAGGRSRPGSVRAGSVKSQPKVFTQPSAAPRQALRETNTMEASVAVASSTNLDPNYSLASISTISYNDFEKAAMSSGRCSSMERPPTIPQKLFNDS